MTAKCLFFTNYFNSCFFEIGLKSNSKLTYCIINRAERSSQCLLGPKWILKEIIFVEVNGEAGRNVLFRLSIYFYYYLFWVRGGFFFVLIEQNETYHDAAGQRNTAAAVGVGHNIPITHTKKCDGDQPHWV